MLLFLLLLILVPVLGTLYNSLFRDTVFLPKEFLGLGNYGALLSQSGFRQAALFTLLFVVVSVPLELALGMALALLLNEPIRGRGWFRATVLIPWAIPAAISARTWELIYNYQYGPANYLLHLLGLEPVNWLGSDIGAFLAVVLADAWKTTPFVALILLAGLAAIPRDLIQQAQVDGAHIGQRFLHVILPLLRPVLVVALLFRTIDALRIFDLNYVLTGGGPGGATTSFSLLGYKYFLAGDFGTGSAVSVILFVIALGLSLAYIHFGRFGENLR